jgi:hypothetical protein
MKSYTPAIILLSLSNTVAFAPHLQTVLRSHHHDAHQAHPPHKNQYLEQLATSSQDMKSDTLSYSQASSTNNPTINAAATTLENEEKESLLLKIKQAGLAGAISYALWELGAFLTPIFLRMRLIKNADYILHPDKLQTDIDDSLRVVQHEINLSLPLMNNIWM